MVRKIIGVLFILVISSCSLLEEEIVRDKSEIIGAWKLVSSEFVGEVIEYDSIQYIRKFTNTQSIVYDNKNSHFSKPKVSSYQWENGVVIIGSQRYEVTISGDDLILAEEGSISMSSERYSPYTGVLPVDSNWLSNK